ncbi:MAG: hypothetical protein IKX14_02180 [Neisseriaceae bacterium]|nr:hypothetical protein [Neisseriaceae bacterium]
MHFLFPYIYFRLPEKLLYRRRVGNLLPTRFYYTFRLPEKFSSVMVGKDAHPTTFFNEQTDLLTSNEVRFNCLIFI